MSVSCYVNDAALTDWNTEASQDSVLNGTFSERRYTLLFCVTERGQFGLCKTSEWNLLSLSAISMATVRTMYVVLTVSAALVQLIKKYVCVTMCACTC